MYWRYLKETIENNALEILRLYVGAFLLLKGVQFLTHPDLITNLVSGHVILIWNAIIAHYIVLAHLVGGTLLVIGLSTRLAALAQIPILSGAVFLVHLEEGLLGYNQSLEYASLMLIILIILSITGSKSWSVDTYVQDQDPL